MASSYTSNDAKEIKESQTALEDKLDGSAFKVNPSNNEFPAKYFAKKDDEKRLRLVQDYVRYLKGSNIDTIYTPTKDDYDMLMRKDEERELVNFESFLQSFFDLDDPIQKKLLNEIYPNYYERRMEVIRDTLQIQEKLARLKLFGPQTKEDVFFLYGLFNGDIVIPDKAVFNLNAETNEDLHGQAFNRGLLNVHRWTPTSYSEPIGKNKAEVKVGRSGFDIGGIFDSSKRNKVTPGVYGKTVFSDKAFATSRTPEEQTDFMSNLLKAMQIKKKAEGNNKPTVNP